MAEALYPGPVKPSRSLTGLTRRDRRRRIPYRT